MNIFRFFGDLSHLASIFILLYAIEKNKSIKGLSLKTQVLYVGVFVTRYLNLFTRFYSLYNSLLKVFFIASSIYTVYIMTHKYQKTAKEYIDTFPVKYLAGGSLILALIFTHKYSFGEVTWSFSIWLEAVAIIPQLFILQRTGEAENITTHYIFSLGLYRALYIPNWIYRYWVEGHFDYISVVAGLVQTAVYSDFFYIYYTKVMKGKKFELPV
ncbi:Erd2 protein [Scheffersomyces xylosifermentans]|uniref:Erd2 protein n=1 Tax=Scheffersomyces xylosifermentans TaxID=1304137 RepID=UPI00315C69A9